MTDEINEPQHPLTSPPAPVPAGWYPTPDGGQRHWDGNAWTDLAWGEPSAKGLTNRKVNPWRSRNLIIAAIVAAVVLLGLVGGGIAIKASSDAHLAAVRSAQIKAAKQRAADAAAAADLKKTKDDAERALRATMV